MNILTLAQVAAELSGQVARAAPTGAAFIDLVLGHYDAMLGFYGTELGSRVARKHLGWYMDGTGAETKLRKAVLTTRNPAEVFKLLPDALTSVTVAA